MGGHNAGTVCMDPLDITPPTWKVIYELGPRGVIFRVRAPPELLVVLVGCLALDWWGWVWSKRSTLLYVLRGKQEAPPPSPLVWKMFRKLFLPKWDLDVGRCGRNSQSGA